MGDLSESKLVTLIILYTELEFHESSKFLENMLHFYCKVLLSPSQQLKSFSVIGYNSQ